MMASHFRMSLIEGAAPLLGARPYSLAQLVESPHHNSGQHRLVNRAHWPTKENRQNFGIFCIFPAHAKNGPRWPQMGPGGFFPTKPDLADILGRTDFDFENFFFLFFFGSQISRFPGPRFQNFHKSDKGLSRAQAGPKPGPSRAQAGPKPGPSRAQARPKPGPSRAQAL